MHLRAGRSFHYGGHLRQVRVAIGQLREPFGFQRFEDKQDRDADRHGLGKNQPKAAHNRNFFGVMGDGG